LIENRELVPTQKKIGDMAKYNMARGDKRNPK
jgi:hypothetical protein